MLPEILLKHSKTMSVSMNDKSFLCH